MLSDYLKMMLEEYLHLSKYLTKEEIILFYEKISFYIKKVRINDEALLARLEKLIEVYSDLEFNIKDIIIAIYNEPSLIHASKEELIYKYLMLIKVIDVKSKKCIRRDIFVNHPRDLRVSLPVLYARIKILSNSEITRRKLLKITHEEFLNTYCLEIPIKTKEELIKLYPFDLKAAEEVFSWPGNEDIKERLTQKTIGGGYHV